MILQTYSAELKSCLETFLVSCKFFVTFTVFELFSKNWFENFQISCGLKFEHSVTQLFLGIQGGSTT